MARHVGITSPDYEPTTEIEPMKWQDLLPPTTDNTTTWDFTPFLTAPAVQAKSGSDSQVNLINIPRTKIASPLASNLSPRQLMDIKETLVGKDGNSGGGGKGNEIWLSWKRAWDIWNNNYIGGRINSVWIRQEWEDREARQKKWDEGRDARRRAREKKKIDAAGGHPPLDPDHDPLLPEDQLPKAKPPVEKGHNIPMDLGGESIVAGWSYRDSRIDSVSVNPLDSNTPPYPAQDDKIWELVTRGSKKKGGKVKEEWILHKKSASDNDSEKAESSPGSLTNPKAAIVESDDEENTRSEKTGSEPGNAPPVDDCVMEIIVDDLESDSDSEPPPKEPNPNGSSGGYRPLKMVEEYEELTEDKDDGKVWVDAVVNTVWSPRRAREKTLKIDLDDDIEAFHKKTELEVDGGVDCSRSPFPVLRSLIEYVRTPEGAFRKKKAWDGVTGTIFNMPTRPPEPCLETADEKQRVKDMYSDYLRDNLFGNYSNIFPLDIHRVLKVAPDIDMPRDICDQGETRVRDPALYPKKEYRDMMLDDAWYVTDAQKLARDAPPRQHPPKWEEFSGKYLLLDDQLWREEKLRDLKHDAAYFVTNLHGGTLIVNGMEIKKGDVAGPLPEFAIIECPGGQVAFWWGVSGRHYGSKSQDSDYSPKWDILRRMKGWKYVGKSAGEVWDTIMRDRKEREKTGENEDDDDQWAIWKKAEKAKANPSAGDKTDEPRQLGQYTPVPHFSKDNGKEELKWLSIQEEEEQEMLKESQQATSLIIPDENAQWPGNASSTKLSHELTKAEKNGRWRVNESRQLALQTAVNEKVEEDRAKRLEKELEREKRKAEEDLQSDVKRRRILSKVMKKAADDAAKELKERAYAENTKKLNEMIRKEQLYNAAIVASLQKQNEGLTEEDALREVQRQKKREEDRLEKQRIELNKQLKAANLPEIPAPAPMDLDAVKAATEKQMEEARKRDQQKKALEAIRKAEHAQALQAARAKQDAERKAKQAKAGADTSAASLTLQTRWESLIDEFHSHPLGTPVQVQAARNLVAFNNSALMAPADRAAWLVWQKGQTPGQITDHSAAMESAKFIIKMNEEAQEKLAPTTTTKRPSTAPPVAKPPAITVKLPPTVPSTAVPKTVDKALQNVIEQYDPWDLDLQKAQLNSIETHMKESREAMKTRAASANKSPLEYVNSEGYPDVEAYMAAQRRMVEEDQKPVPDADEIRTEAEANAAHLEAYKQDMRAAIKEGLRVRMAHRNYTDMNAYAWKEGYNNARAWIDEKLMLKNITLKDIPSRKPVSEMTEKEKVADKDRWRAWCGQINEAANWKARIVRLPGPPNYTTPTVEYSEGILRPKMTCEI